MTSLLPMWIFEAFHNSLHTHSIRQIRHLLFVLERVANVLCEIFGNKHNQITLHIYLPFVHNIQFSWANNRPTLKLHSKWNAKMLFDQYFFVAFVRVLALFALKPNLHNRFMTVEQAHVNALCAIYTHSAVENRFWVNRMNHNCHCMVLKQFE